MPLRARSTRRRAKREEEKIFYAARDFDGVNVVVVVICFAHLSETRDGVKRGVLKNI